MKDNDFHDLGYSYEEYTEYLSDEERHRLLCKWFSTLIKDPNDWPITNPFSFEINGGTLDDGAHLLLQYNGYHLWKKFITKDNIVIQAFNYEGRKWIEIPKPWGVDEGENN